MRPSADRQAPKAKKEDFHTTAAVGRVKGARTALQRRFNVASTSAKRMGKVQVRTSMAHDGRLAGAPPARHWRAPRPYFLV